MIFREDVSLCAGWNGNPGLHARHCCRSGGHRKPTDLDSLPSDSIPAVLAVHAQRIHRLYVACFRDTWIAVHGFRCFPGIMQLFPFLPPTGWRLCGGVGVTLIPRDYFPVDPRDTGRSALSWRSNAGVNRITAEVA